VQNSTVLEVSDFRVSVDSALNDEGFATVGGDLNVLVDTEVSTLDVNVELFVTGEAEVVSVLAFLELEGQDTHTEEVRSVDTFVALSNDNLNTLEVGSLGSPIARRSRSVFLSGEDDGVNSSSLVFGSSVEDSHFFSGGNMHGSRSSLLNHLVDKTDVSEGTSSHDLIVTSARSVGVEVLIGDSTLSEEASSRGVLGNLSGGGDVISSNGITHVQKAVSVVDIRDFLDLSFGGLEERRVVDVGGVIIPRVEFTFRGLEVLPHLGSLKDVVVNVNEHLRFDASFSNCRNFITSGPDFRKEDILSILVLTNRLSFEVVVDGTGKGVSNDKRRRSQVVSSSLWMDSTFEVSVSGKDSRGNEIVINNGILSSFRNFSRVTNTGHATVTSNSETKSIKGILDTSVLKVVLNNSRSW